MIVSRRNLLRAGAAALLPARLDAAETSVIAIEHARVHPGDGRRLDDATVVLRGSRVAAIGKDVQTPSGARVIDGRKLWVTPGLIDAESSTGLADVFQEKSSVDVRLDEHYDAVRAAFSVVDGLNPRAITIPITRMEGITATVLAPDGGLVAGQGALVHLAGATVPEMLLRTPVAIYASLSASARAAGYGARGGQLLRLRELIDDVRQYTRRRQDFERNQMRKVAASRLDLEALTRVVERRVPLVVEAHRASDIEAALRFADDERLDLVLTGAEEGWLVAPAIAAAKVPVVLAVTPNLPRAFESLGARLENAALLAEAKVKLAISPRSRSDHFSRTLRLEAGTAVAHGLPWETALAAVTRHPAEIFGAPDLGTLAPGRDADLVVWSGDPFEPLTRARHVFIAGREQPLRSRQTDLFERYRSLASPRK